MELSKKINSGRNALAQAMLNIVSTDPWYPIKLRSGEFKLEYSYAAIKEVFRSTGKNINVGEISMADLEDLDTLTQVIAAGLIIHHHQMNPDPAWVESQLLMKHRAYYTFCVSKAIEATQPDLDMVKRIMDEAEKEETKDLPTELPLEVTLP